MDSALRQRKERMVRANQTVLKRVSATTRVLLMAALAASPIPAAVLGSMAGLVRDDRGLPQMGATVILLSSEGRSLRRVYTDDRGGFLINDLFPGLYGVRVSFPSFLPALRDKILIEAGGRSYLDVRLAGLLSSVQLVYPEKGDWRDMSEDWKWVLRTASATRPVLRYLPGDDREGQSVTRKISGAFGDVQGLVRVSAGDGGPVSGLGSESDLGTAVAVAASLFGNSNVIVSGNLGYGTMHGAPSAGFHTSYSREMPYGAQPEISVTVRQLFRPFEAGQILFGPPGRSAAALQTFTLGYQDRVSLGDTAELEYGFLYDSVSFLDRLNYVSTFGKLTYNLDDSTHVILRYADGVPRADADVTGGDSLGRNLSALAVYPRMSLLGGRSTLQRGEHLEAGVQKQVGAGVFEVAAYRDNFSNTAITAIASGGLYTNGDLLPDLFSTSSTFNGGSYQVSGYRASYSRKLNDHLRAGVAYGLSGVLAPERGVLFTDDPNELRSILKVHNEHSVTTQVVAQLPQSHTSVSSSYQWTSRASSVTVPDLFNSSDTRALPGLNITVRQPLPQFSYLPGRFEAMAEFRNLLAQGYVPVVTTDGRRTLLIQSVRSFRGGLNFVF